MTAPFKFITNSEVLSKHSYYRIGGAAKYFATPTSLTELKQLSTWLKKSGERFFILGAGSNVLFDDQGFDGVILYTGKIDQHLEQQGELVSAGCSVSNIQLLRLCMKEGLSGLEFLVGIPGSVGGAVFMNAGTHRGEAKDAIQAVEAFDLAKQKQRSVTKDELTFIYRSQTFLNPNEIVLGATFKIKSMPATQVQNDIQNLLARRKKNQPIDKPSCGSVFKNPSGTKSAWQLIDEVGLRGHRIGEAEISSMHCNFIINHGQAKASDVRSLIALAKKRVQEQFGIELQEEVKIIPPDGGRHLEPK